MGVSSTATIRRYEPADHALTVELLYLSSGGMYDRYAGSEALARRAIGAALERDKTTASADVVWVAEIDGELAGVMAGMPWAEWGPRAGRFLRVTLRAQPPWRWPRTLIVHRASGRTAPGSPAAGFYVDSLASAPALRRRGAARALLGVAEREARRRGLHSVALDTWQDNSPARALYRREGFEEVAFAPAAAGLPSGVSLVKELR